MTEVTRELAEELPDYQTSRGNEFRTVSVEDRMSLARVLVVARSQVNASNADWDDDDYRRSMRRVRNRYMHISGILDIRFEEAERIWWNYVYDDPSPHERRESDMI